MSRTYLMSLALSLILACCGGDMVVYGPVPNNGYDQEVDTGNYPKTDPMTSSGGSDVTSASSGAPTGTTGGASGTGGTRTGSSTNWGNTGFGSHYQ